MNREVLKGVVIGVVGVWLWHHFASPLPGAKKS
jgi:hypothetical protein